MECVVPNRYIKLLAKSIQCMAKVGEELFIEATEHRLTFRALNPSRSAFMAFYLDERFFDSYSLEDGIERKYQVKLKPCQAVFRQFNTVETCTIRLDEFEQRLVFELLCKHGIKKVYKLSFEECEPLQALYTKDNVPNRVAAVPKKLVDSLNNFHNQLDEVTLIATKDSLKIKSYVDDAKAAGKVLQTELSIDVQDFDAFEIRNETQVTFCLKEIKAILAFCDASGQPVTILFERSGRPITLSIKYFGVFEADFVLATLVDQNLSSQSTGTSTSSGSSSTPSTPLTSSSPSTNTSNSNDNSRKRKVDDIQAWSPTTDKSPSSVNSTPMSSQSGVTPSKPSSSASSIHSTTPSVGSSNPHNNNALDDDDNLQFGMDTEGPGADYQDLEQQDGTPPLKKQRSLSQSGPPVYNISSRVQDYNTNVDEDMDHMVEDDEEVPDSFDES